MYQSPLRKSLVSQIVIHDHTFLYARSQEAINRGGSRIAIRWTRV
jgi:hypothetical protein